MQWLAANVVHEATGAPVLPPYAVVEAGGVRVGFIGVVLEDTPQIQLSRSIEGLRFLDEAETVNRYAAELAGRGIRAIVVLIHQGGTGKPDGSEPIRGPIVEVVERLAPEVDLVMSGHTHQGYVGRIPRKGGGPPLLVAQAYANGTAFAEFDVRLDRRTGDVAAAEARLVTTYHQADPNDPASLVPPDPTVAAIVARAEAAVAPLARRVVGRAASAVSRARSPAGESALGNLVADAHRAATGADVAVTNPGGLRQDLPAGDVTYGALFAAQPFGNTLVTMTLTGAEFRRVLEQQWQRAADGSELVRVLQVSGLRYTWDDRRPSGDRVTDLRLAPDGRPIEPARPYRVTVNSFLGDGGDGFTLLREGRDRQAGPADLEALVAYIERLPQPFSAATEGRIARAAAAPAGRAP
jgi:5'-nucleotidase